MTHKNFADQAIRHLMLSPKFKGLNFDGTFRGSQPRIKHILKNKEDVYKLLFCKSLRNCHVCANLFNATKPKFHQYAHHVNSSQIFCINVFGPLMILDDSYESLRKLLVQMGVKFKSSIEHAQFEYTPETTGDRTQFDFYVKTEKGEEAFFEFKYSERGFGTPSNGSCNEIDFYAQLCRESVNLSGMAKMKVDDSVRKNFFSDLFQVWRNIGHVKNEKQYSVFVFPFKNETLLRRFPKESMKNVLQIDSENIYEYAKSAFGIDSDLTRYYCDLKETYFNF